MPHYMEPDARVSDGWSLDRTGYGGVARLHRSPARDPMTEENVALVEPLTQVAAAALMRLDQPKVSALINGQLTNFSSER
jgi:hypothetical protein